MRMILIYNIFMMQKNIKLNYKNNESVKIYVRELTDNLDIMAEKMTKKELDVEAYEICSALDLIKHKSKISN